MTAYCLISYCIGYALGFFTRGIKNCTDKRRIRLNIRCHHQNIAGLQGGILIEHIKQKVIEHFNFTHGTVTGVDADRIVCAHLFFSALQLLSALFMHSSPVNHVQNIRLDCMQQRVSCRLLKEGIYLRIVIENYAEKIPPQLTH